MGFLKLRVPDARAAWSLGFLKPGLKNKECLLEAKVTNLKNDNNTASQKIKDLEKQALKEEGYIAIENLIVSSYPDIKSKLNSSVNSNDRKDSALVAVEQILNDLKETKEEKEKFYKERQEARSELKKYKKSQEKELASVVDERDALLDDLEAVKISASDSKYEAKKSSEELEKIKKLGKNLKAEYEKQKLKIQELQLQNTKIENNLTRDNNELEIKMESLEIENKDLNLQKKEVEEQLKNADMMTKKFRDDLEKMKMRCQELEAQQKVQSENSTQTQTLMTAIQKTLMTEGGLGKLDFNYVMQLNQKINQAVQETLENNQTSQFSSNLANSQETSVTTNSPKSSPSENYSNGHNTGSASSSYTSPNSFSVGSSSLTSPSMKAPLVDIQKAGGSEGKSTGSGSNKSGKKLVNLNEFRKNNDSFGNDCGTMGVHLLNSNKPAEKPAVTAAVLKPSTDLRTPPP